MRSLPAVPTPHTTPSTPSTISRLKLNAVSKFRHIGRKSVQNNRPQESNVRRQEFDEVFVSPVPRDSRPLNVTRSQLQTQTGHSLARQEIPAHARHSSTPVINTTLHNSPRVSDVGRALTQPRSPSSSHNGAPQIQHSRAPRPSLDRAAPNSHSPVPNPPRIRLERRRTTGARTDNQRSVDSPAQSTSSRRDTATHTPMSPAISSRMGRFGIYASPSPTVVGGSVSSPAPHQRWMPASPRPLDAGKVVADARRETPRHPVQAAVITDSHVESGFSVAGDATSVTPGAESAKNVTGNTIGPPEDLPTPRPRPRTRKQTLKEEEVFAMKLANRMSAFIPQRSSVASPRICQDNELYPIINLNNDGEDGEEGDVSDGETNSEHRSDTLTPKAVDQSKGLPSEETASGVPESLKGDERKTESATPLSTFLSSAKEMNDNFIKSTSSAWDKLFFRSSGSGKGKEKECNPVTDTIPSNSSSASTPTPSRTTLSSSTPAPTPDQVYAGTGEGEIEGSRDIMLYSPLIPTSSSLVEVGESEVVSFYGEDEGVDRAYRAELRRRWADGRGFVSFESLAAMGKAEENSNAEDQTMRSPDNALQIDLGDDSGSRVSAPGQNPEQSDDADNKTPKVKERVVWKPSPTQISVQVLWWGYRMYVSSHFHRLIVTQYAYDHPGIFHLRFLLCLTTAPSKQRNELLCSPPPSRGFSATSPLTSSLLLLHPLLSF